MAVAPALPRVVDPPAVPTRRKSKRGWVFHAVMGPVAFVWILPLLFVIMVSLRSFDDIATNGLGSLPEALTLGAFKTAWIGGSIGGALRNSLIVTVFTVVAVLFLASLAAFALSRYRIPFGVGFCC